MREFKFRYYWFWEKRMVNWDEMKGEIEDIPWAFAGRLAQCSPVMQYTGLQDKNNMEIYEGDVISISESKFKVYYASQSARYRAENLDTGWHFDLDELFPIDNWEVIGNIYEWQQQTV
jgi:hypothetical protein